MTTSELDRGREELARAVAARAWEEGYEAGVHNTIHASSIERGNETPETNPYKEG